MKQTIITPQDNYRALDAWIAATGEKKLFLVCDGSIRFLSNSVPASALTGTVNAVQLADDSNEGE